jgi:hypothetical protein
MARYKVIALSVGGLRNKIFSSGDIVTDDMFPEGNAGKLVEQNFLAPYEETAVEAVEDEKTIDDYTAGEIKALLDERGITYKSNASKTTLFELLKS